jgi:hypothetical protein
MLRREFLPHRNNSLVVVAEREKNPRESLSCTAEKKGTTD